MTYCLLYFNIFLVLRKEPIMRWFYLTIFALIFLLGTLAMMISYDANKKKPTLVDQHFVQELLAVERGDLIEDTVTHEVDMAAGRVIASRDLIVVFREPGLGSTGDYTNQLAAIPLKTRIVRKGDPDWAETAKRWIAGHPRR